MSNIFDELAEQAKENEERWKRIDVFYNRLKEIIDKNLPVEYDEIFKNTISLLLLLTDQLRPASSAGEQIKSLQNDINDMLSDVLSSTGRKK